MLTVYIKEMKNETNPDLLFTRRIDPGSYSPDERILELKMKRYLTALTLVSLMMTSVGIADSKENVKVKTRLDHLKGTPLVLVISQIPDEITSITCEKWTMMGQSSYKGHNQFSIPGAGKPLGVSIAVLDTSGFDGYCKGVNDIQAHTDEGDYPCHLDAGPGNWSDSTKLICDAKASD